MDVSVCQNSSLATQPIKEIDIDAIVNFYLSNPITKAIVIGGLEPMLQFEELTALIEKLRAVTLDDIVIYTGYKEEELVEQLRELRKYPNIIVKFGRYVPNENAHLDEVLGIELASNNQYAKYLVK